jgi:D-alanyl-lipoteichoic acid acyltransferase DltB (MBOAT superfamily)
MLFNSLEFALFFPVVTILFFLLPHRYRWFLLLAASCFFYMFFRPIYIFILAGTIVIDYYAGIWIARQPDKRKRKRLLLLSIFANVGVLVVFKYFNFLADNVNSVLHSFHSTTQVPLLEILLPIGLSFHTFQAMSYTIEVYRGNQQPEKHFGIYALYVMFYPQLVAGPIERPQNILHQFHEVKKFDYNNMKEGLIMIAWGLFKKVVIADRLAMFVNQVYGNPFDYTGIPLIIGTVFFAFQIFCDFSGYSDIAIGSARCMGYNLMTNFDRPYMSTSISEFWRRWHISLSSWFRDYVYIPLGGNRVSKSRWYFNLLAVFVLSGIWHGANWTFVVWGLLHGLYLVGENEFYRVFPKLQDAKSRVTIFVKRVIVFTLVCIAWVFFRANNVGDAFHMIGNFFTGIPQQVRQIISNENFGRLKFLYVNQPAVELFVALLFLSIMMLVHSYQRKLSFDQWLGRKKPAARWAIYYGLVLLFICFGVFNRSEFIYFQF